MSTDTNFTPIKTLNWLFFDLNSFFASVEQQDQPHLRGKPVAVVPMMTDSTCAIAASYEAKAYGIKTGTKIFDAKKLCPDLICVLARHDKYVHYHERIMAEVERHIHIDKICSIDEAACQLLGPEREIDNALKIAASIKRGLLENVGTHIRCSIGIAPNAFLAKIATDMQKPDGLVVLRPQRYKAAICALNLSDLTGIGRNMEARLNAAGIYTIEQLWNLSPKHARKIWGSVAGERFWYKLHGYEVPDKETQKSVVGHSRVLEPQHRPPEQAYNMARQLTLKAASRLRRYNLYARRYNLSVRTIEGRRWAGEMRFTEAQDNFAFLNALQTLWADMLRAAAPQKLKKISVNIYDLHQPQDVTLDLFAQLGEKTNAEQKKKDERLSGVMDQLAKKYGRGAVQLGTCPKSDAGYVGTKIAFTRVPSLEEFEN